MRSNMDPLTPTTSTLAPAISHIAETARSLVVSLQDGSAKSPLEYRSEDPMVTKKRKQQQTVRWVLSTPHRLQTMLDADNLEEAKSDWREVDTLLQHWDGVPGVSELRNTCMKTLGHDSVAQSS